MLTLSLALIAGGLLLAAVETHTPTYGVLGGAGLAAALAGVVLLFVSGQDGWAWPLAAVCVLLGTGLAVAVWKAVRAQLERPRVGLLVGARGVVKERLAPRGWVLVEGARWQAQLTQSPGEPAKQALEPGAAVEVTAVHGLDLEVRPLGGQ